MPEKDLVIDDVYKDVCKTFDQYYCTLSLSSFKRLPETNCQNSQNSNQGMLKDPQDAKIQNLNKEVPDWSVAHWN